MSTTIEAQRIAAFATTAYQAGAVREALLLRLCLCGTRIATATRMKVEDLVTFDEESNQIDVSPALSELGEGLDALFPDTLGRWVLRYFRRDESLLKNGTNAPAFPSRKGKGAITSRTAERCLKAAWKTHGRSIISPAPSFRRAKVVGARWCSDSHRDARSTTLDNDTTQEKLGDELTRAVHVLDWLLIHMFPNDVHSSDDIRQEAILAYLEAHRTGKLARMDKVSAAFLLRAGCNHAKKYERQKDAFQPGKLDDWSFIAAGETGRGVFPNKLKNQTSSTYEMTMDDAVAMLCDLDGLAKSVIELRFGFRDRLFRTRREVSLELHVPETTIRVIERQALDKLRELLANRR